MPYASMTRAQLRARLQDRYTGDPFWTAGEANTAINEALRQFNLYTGFWWGTVTAVTQAGTPFVAVPAAMTWRTRVLPPLGPALTQKGLLTLYRQRPGWRTQTIADGGEVPARVEEWAPVGITRIAIWPRDAGGTPLQVTGVRVTPVLTDDGQTVDLGEEQVGPLLDEALWILTFKRPSLKDSLEAGHQRFLQAMLTMNDRLRRSAFYRKTLGLPEDARMNRIARRTTEGT